MGACRNLRRKLIQGAHKTAIGLRGIEAPQGHAKLQLWHRPEERIDGLNNLLCLSAALRWQTAQSCVQRNTAHRCKDVGQTKSRKERGNRREKNPFLCGQLFAPINIIVAYIRAPICTVRAENCRAAPAARCASRLCYKTVNVSWGWAGAKELTTNLPHHKLAGYIIQRGYVLLGRLRLQQNLLHLLAKCLPLGTVPNCVQEGVEVRWGEVRWDAEWVSETLPNANVILTRQLDQPHRQRSRGAVHPYNVAAKASRVCQEAKHIHV